MSFGILLRDPTPVDAPFRRSGPAPEAVVRLGSVPGFPYGHVEVPGFPFGRRRFGESRFGEDVPSSGLYETPIGPIYDPNALETSRNQGSSWNWQSSIDATANLAASIVNAFTQGGVQTCPSGYVNIGGGRCAKTTNVAAGGASTALVVGAIGIAALLLLRKKGA